MDTILSNQYRTAFYYLQNVCDAYVLKDDKLFYRKIKEAKSWLDSPSKIDKNFDKEVQTGKKNITPAISFLIKIIDAIDNNDLDTAIMAINDTTIWINDSQMFRHIPRLRKLLKEEYTNDK